MTKNQIMCEIIREKALDPLPKRPHPKMRGHLFEGGVFSPSGVGPFPHVPWGLEGLFKLSNFLIFFRWMLSN